MTFKNQVKKIKDNWLIIALVLIALILFSSGGDYISISKLGGNSYDYAQEAAYGAPSIARGYYPEQDFAPEVEERMKTKSATISTEVERGTFGKAESNLKGIADANDAFILDENVNKIGPENFKYSVGRYRIKVETGKYDSVVSQLKKIGNVQSFSENIDDITGTYINLKVDLAAEKEKLQRYEEMYDEATEIDDKIALSDRIFNQERIIKYLEKRIEDLDNKVSYSTISITINEKQSGYAGMMLVKLSELIKGFVGSLNTLLEFVFAALPWAIAVLLGWLIYKRVKAKK